MVNYLRAVSARRLILLATVANVGIAAAVVGVSPQSLVPAFPTAAAAESAQRPVGFGDLVEKVKPAVISVRVKVNANTASNSLEGNLPFPQNSPMDRFFRRFGMPNQEQGPQLNRRPVTAQGSGFFISADGYAVTNNHVVDKATSVEVVTDEGKTLDAKVIGTDSRTDLALIKVEGRNDFPHVTFADKAPRIGDWVVAVGNPFGLGGSVTAGIVSARGRDIGSGPYDDYIQIDAPINRGNSGGPTFDMDGNVIGVNTAIFSPSGGSVGIGFDIPANTVESVIAQLKDKGTVNRGWIGTQIQPVTAEIAEGLGMKGSEGALVTEPQANSPAAKAGILSGDVITAVNGHAVKDARDLARQIGAMAPGTTAKLSVWRKGEEKSISLTLGEMPKEREARATDSAPQGTDTARLGLTVAPAAQVAGAGAEGVVVTNVDPNGPASERGVKTGDVILDVGGKAVATPADVRDAISEAQKSGKRTVLMRMKSNDSMKFVAVPLGRA
jgi:serine protease Do